MRLVNCLPHLLVILATAALAALTAMICRTMLPGLLPPPLATVDITAIVRQHHVRLAAGMAQAASNDDRQRFRRQSAAYGPALEQAIAALRQECGCILVLREAIVAGDVPDLTARLVALVDTP
ncbi:TrbI F-type domain-containing protein [Pseudoduganella umbonata]|uniref:Type-F conjugative transfer system protein TrbI n=1 Tax=Pseudoduganella umbonata TaxID=864828 RepID=A0A4P8HHM0_9BURK|nr:TrbI F-type domain-containing protein [Pseudoduganella umbonata]MBB3221710.1 hypothetical protein [Pseudoduganella umbonata]QCP09069.1 hypothetical protein FCL38_00425 [Pseudoduganella umbonata]